MSVSRMEVLEKRLHAVESRLCDTQKSGAVCTAAAAADAKIEDLGKAFNEIEPQLYKLECAYEDLAARFDGLTSRFAAVEQVALSPPVTEQQARSEGKGSLTSSPKRTAKGNSEESSPLSEQESSQQTAIAALAERVQRFEASVNAAAQMAHLSTHQLAQQLTSRLQNGDFLSVSLLLELQAALGSTTSRTLAANQPGILAIANDSTISTPFGTTSGSEATRKRPLGRPPKSSAGDSEQPPAKRQRTQYAAGQTNGPSLVPEGRRGRGRPRKIVQPPATAVATNATAEKEEAPNHSNNETTVAHVAPMANMVSNQEPDAVASKSSTKGKVATPKKKTKERPTTPVPNEEEETGHSHVPSYLPTSDMEDAADIPPERRSGRTPKPSKKFGDVVSWKEANARMQGYNTMTPYKAKS